MKNLIFSLTILCLPLLMLGQNQNIEQFCNQYKNLEEVTSINLSGQLVNIIFANSEEDTDKKSSKISNIRVLIVEKSSIVKSRDYRQLIKNVKKDDFEELMRLKDGDDAIDFYLKEVGSDITNVLITVSGNDGFIMLSLEGLFNFDDLNKLDLDIEGAEHLKKLPKNKEEVKRA